MSDKQQKWLYVVLVIIVPFILVHVFEGSPIPRLLSVIWLFTIFPFLILFLVFSAKETVRLKNYRNPVVEKRLTVAIKALAFLLGVFCLYYFTLPIWVATYNVYGNRMPLTEINDSVSNLSSAVLATGLYLDINLTTHSSTDYLYWLPTTYNFGDAHYTFAILTGTNIILQVQPE
jgi:hypothetical protein